MINDILSDIEKKYNCAFEYVKNNNRSIIYCSDELVIKITKYKNNDIVKLIYNETNNIYNKIKHKSYILDLYDLYIYDNYLVCVMEKIDPIDMYKRKIKLLEDNFLTLYDILLDLWKNNVIHDDVIFNIGIKNDNIVIYDYDSLCEKHQIKYIDKLKNIKTFDDYIKFTFIPKPELIYDNLYKDNSFLILYDGITGSTNLVSILNNTDNVTCLHNLFGSDKNVTIDYCKKKIEYINKKLFKNKFNGIKYRYTGYPSINDTIEYVCRFFSKVIILKRDNLLEQEYSSIIKMKTHQSNIKENENILDFDEICCDSKSSISKIKDRIYRYNLVIDKLRDLKNILVVDYDSLFEKYTLDKIYKFLDIPIQEEYKCNYKKLNSNKRYEKIKNKDELKKEFYKIPFEFRTTNRLLHKNYNKIDWGKRKDKKNNLGDVITNFNYNDDNVLSCYSGTINKDMALWLKQKCISENYDINRILILTNTDSNKEIFNTIGINSIFCHRQITEINISNFNIMDIEKQYDFISLSREDKREKIEDFLTYKWCSILKNGENHYPNKSNFDMCIDGVYLDYKKLNTFISNSKFGYYVIDHESELKPLLEFWLCGIPVVTKINEIKDGRSKLCTPFNSINVNQFNDYYIYNYNMYDSNKIRSYIYETIMKHRLLVNEKIDKLYLNPNLKMDYF